jgi:DNA-binding CsgD family transcriptional regulator
MVMHAENLSNIASIRGQLSEVSAERIPRIAHFVVDGHSLIAVAHAGASSADADQVTNAEQRMVVGRVTCAGTRYLIYDTGGTSEAGTVETPSAAEVLTRRELQIASLIGDGKSDKEIALQLGISGYTVREHIRRIFAKLNIGRRAAIVSHVLRQRGASVF